MGAACVTTIHTALWLRVGGQNVAASGLQLSLCEANTLLPPGMCEESQIKACSCLLSPSQIMYEQSSLWHLQLSHLHAGIADIRELMMWSVSALMSKIQHKLCM